MKPVDLFEGSAAVKPGCDTAMAHWSGAIRVLILGLAALVFLYIADVRTMVHTWWTVGTYAHGLVVYPVSAWLIWRKRDVLATQVPRPFLPAAALLAALSVLWLLGDLSNTQTLREFAFVASVPVLAWAVLGNTVARTLLFPLAMTLFAWPVGEFFVPTMIDYTADFTVAALRLSGVPVYREGNFFVIPTGNWSVVEGCSGIRYLIASVYGGAIFAYLNFRDWRRRLPFMAAAIIVPIFANWVRAYMIVMLGHLSDNRIATGVDHIIYGWFFFGIVILALFWVGSRFSDAQDSVHRPLMAAYAPPAGTPALLAATAIALVLAAIGPAVAFGIERVAPVHTGPVALQPPATDGNWTAIDSRISNWEPRIETPVASHAATYSSSSDSVGMLTAYYRAQEVNGKMLTYGSTALGDFSVRGWRTLDRSIATTHMNGGTLDVIERRVVSEGQNLITWQWYWTGRRNTVGFWEAKLAEMQGMLGGFGDDAATVVLHAAYAEDPEAARAILRRFVAEMGPAIQKSLEDAARR
ncbi:MAG: exosortase A [Burkholderiales bacterium]|nr:exosortase A [Burkholderiales bacterium]